MFSYYFILKKNKVLTKNQLKNLSIINTIFEKALLLIFGDMEKLMSINLNN